jgi:hypothetical protein
MEDQEHVDPSSLSLEQRIAHKVWKIRLHGWEELVTVFRTCPYADDPNYRIYSSLLKNGLSDVNAMVQEKTLEALEVVLNQSDQAKK